MVQLRGITWGHSRGYLPVAATAQRYMELHPDVTIRWDTRSLKAFGDHPIDTLADEYDMLVLDHPWMGFADHRRVLLPLEQHLDVVFLEDQARNTVGQSHASYHYNGHQYALAIDAACPIAFYVPHKLEKLNAQIPSTWEQVLKLAKKGGVLCAGNSTGILMLFYMLCNAKTETMFDGQCVAASTVIQESLEEIRALFSFLPDYAFEKNPIGVYEVLSSGDESFAYCPCDFGYSNYSRTGYSQALVISADVVKYKGKMLKTTLGGAGLALSAKANHLETALDYIKYTACGDIQKSVYVQNGGQPGHRAAWVSDEPNRITHDFFRNTLKTLDNTWLRPRYNGYLEFQENAAVMIREWVMNGGSATELIDRLNALYLKGVAHD